MLASIAIGVIAGAVLAPELQFVSDQVTAAEDWRNTLVKIAKKEKIEDVAKNSGWRLVELEPGLIIVDARKFGGPTWRQKQLALVQQLVGDGAKVRKWRDVAPELVGTLRESLGYEPEVNGDASVFVAPTIRWNLSSETHFEAISRSPEAPSPRLLDQQGPLLKRGNAAVAATRNDPKIRTPEAASGGGLFVANNPGEFVEPLTVKTIASRLSMLSALDEVEGQKLSKAERSIVERLYKLGKLPFDPKDMAAKSFGEFSAPERSRMVEFMERASERGRFATPADAFKHYSGMKVTDMRLTLQITFTARTASGDPMVMSVEY